MSYDGPYYWHREEEFRAREDALRQGRGEESRAGAEDVPTRAEVDRSER